ncbi:hypothetical protein F2Q68_00036884 [Brassica cretica]|uniref:RecF/RecN/SMC N-terminal domain-containing protein n=1 Tax=Brassica cretica TaxID=69181 RepID=A0A8S9H4E9_BRACR|nr:hypothetical protein F2Q68_00036884 [Brassica cretica]
MKLKKFNTVHHYRYFVLEILHIVLFLESLRMKISTPIYLTLFHHLLHAESFSRGERSFSTLCFALALHEMTEAPFRAMDEFDVFMDAVSRKISLDALVDFAIAHGAQWMFITPHDISMVNSHERIKKQQMAAPRS